jgi:hypothetical protein
MGGGVGDGADASIRCGKAVRMTRKCVQALSGGIGFVQIAGEFRFGPDRTVFSGLNSVLPRLSVVFLRMISRWSGGVGGEAGGIPDPSQPRMDANERE